MRYLRKYEKFNSIEYYNKKYSTIIDELISDIKKCITKFNTDTLRFYDVGPKIKRTVKEDVWIYSIYIYKNDVYIEWVYDGEQEENIRDMSFSDVTSIYDFVKNLTLEEMIYDFYHGGENKSAADMIKNNIDKIDFGYSIVSDSDIFQLYEETYEYQIVIDTYEFQKWLLENKPQKIQWLVDNADIDEDVKEEHADIFDVYDLGLL